MTAADRHLLFGLLALQNGIINQGQLVAAFQAWTLDKSRSLADHLQARGDLSGPSGRCWRPWPTPPGSPRRRRREEPGRGLGRQVDAGEPGADRRPGCRSDARPCRLRTWLDRGGRCRTHDVLRRRLGHQRRPAVPRAQATRPGRAGAVFVALDGELNREVALKQILDHHADDPVSRQRFLIEAEITGGLEHPGIVPVYGLGTYDGGRPYYAMRFIKGDSLKEAIERFHGERR